MSEHEIISGALLFIQICDVLMGIASLAVMAGMLIHYCRRGGRHA